MRRVAIFIDAGYFWVQAVTIIHGKKVSRNQVDIDYGMLRQELLDHVTNQFRNSDLLRVYWYDGPGPHGKTPGHFAIEKLDDFKLRLGTRNGIGDQKAVDGLIIADIISLAQSKAISNALLISGDADLTPGVIAAQGLGIRVHLLSMGSPAATSPFLKAEVDFKCHWDDLSVKKFVSASSASPQKSTPVITQDSTTEALPASTTKKTEDPLANIASSVFSKIDKTKYTLAKTGKIPSEIDAQLLRIGFEQLKRPLNEEEKRHLRSSFRKLIAP